jgi:hypothetical protein
VSIALSSLPSVTSDRRCEAQLLPRLQLHTCTGWSSCLGFAAVAISCLVRCRAVQFVSQQDFPLVLDSHVLNGLTLQRIDHDDSSHVNRVRRIACRRPTCDSYSTYRYFSRTGTRPCSAPAKIAERSRVPPNYHSPFPRPTAL